MTFRSKKIRNRNFSKKSRRNKQSNKNRRLKKYGGMSQKYININYVLVCDEIYRVVQTKKMSVDATVGELGATRRGRGDLLFGTPPNLLRSVYSLPPTDLVRAALRTNDGITYNVYYALPKETLAELCDPEFDPDYDDIPHFMHDRS